MFKKWFAPKPKKIELDLLAYCRSCNFAKLMFLPDLVPVDAVGDQLREAKLAQAHFESVVAELRRSDVVFGKLGDDLEQELKILRFELFSLAFYHSTENMQQSIVQQASVLDFFNMIGFDWYWEGMGEYNQAVGRMIDKAYVGQNERRRTELSNWRIQQFNEWAHTNSNQDALTCVARALNRHGSDKEWVHKPKAFSVLCVKFLERLGKLEPTPEGSVALAMCVRHLYESAYNDIDLYTFTQ